MKNWKYLLMTTMVGSALALGACGDDKASEPTEEETATETASGDTQEEAVLEGEVSGDGSVQ